MTTKKSEVDCRPTVSRLQLNLPWSIMDLVAHVPEHDHIMVLNTVGDKGNKMEFQIKRMESGGEPRLVFDFHNADSNVDLAELISNQVLICIKEIIQPAYLCPTSQEPDNDSNNDASNIATKEEDPLLTKDSGSNAASDLIVDESCLFACVTKVQKESSQNTFLMENVASGPSQIANLHSNYEQGEGISKDGQDTVCLEVSVEHQSPDFAGDEPVIVQQSAANMEENVTVLFNAKAEGRIQNANLTERGVTSEGGSGHAMHFTKPTQTPTPLSTVEKHCRKLRCKSQKLPETLPMHFIETVLKKNKTVYKCYECSNVVCSLDKLAGHMARVHHALLAYDQVEIDGKKNSYHCHLCPYTTVLRYAIILHLQRKHNFTVDKPKKKTYPCSICERAYSTYKLLNRHLYRAHKGHPKMKDALIQGQNIHFANKNRAVDDTLVRSVKRSSSISVQCSKCGITLPKPEMFQHIKLAHADEANMSSLLHALRQGVLSLGQYKRCDICNKDIRWRNFSTHRLRTHGLDTEGHAVPRCVCSHCGKTFNDRQGLRLHVKTHSNERNFGCVHCGRCYKDKYQLDGHVRTVHLRRFPFNCAACGRGFRTQVRLSKHICRKMSFVTSDGEIMEITQPQVLEAKLAQVQHSGLDGDSGSWTTSAQEGHGNGELGNEEPQSGNLDCVSKDDVIKHEQAERCEEKTNTESKVSKLDTHACVEGGNRCSKEDLGTALGLIQGPEKDTSAQSTKGQKGKEGDMDRNTGSSRKKENRTSPKCKQGLQDMGVGRVLTRSTNKSLPHSQDKTCGQTEVADCHTLNQEDMWLHPSISTSDIGPVRRSNRVRKMTPRGLSCLGDGPESVSPSKDVSQRENDKCYTEHTSLTRGAASTMTQHPDQCPGKHVLCVICKKQIQNIYLVSHRKSVHGVGTDGKQLNKLSCDLCGKEFNVRKQLMAHMTSHSEERSWQCCYCSKCFKDKWQLMSHERTVHLGHYPYNCARCTRGFRKQTELSRHRCLPSGAIISSDTIAIGNQMYKVRELSAVKVKRKP